MKTLNQIKHDLTGFFNSHAQINQVVYADDFDFNSERNVSYPVANIEWTGSDMSGKKTTHVYKMVLADAVDDNIKAHEDEIFSDMLSIADDFFSWAQEQEGFEFNKSVNIQKISDDAGDRTAGIVFRISLTVIRPSNVCAIPLK